MQQFLMAFYIVFFATGFMGGTALWVLSVRVRSRLVRPLLIFQLFFLVAMGLIIVYFAWTAQPEGIPGSAELVLLGVVNALNAGVWGVVIIIARRVRLPTGRKKPVSAAAEILAALVIVKSLANVFVTPATFPAVAVDAWDLGGHLLSALAMASFGLVLRGPITPHEPPAIRSLLSAYGLLAIVFAPIGLIENAVEAARIPWLTTISLDHFFYLAWNIVSMSAAVRLLRPSESGTPVLDAVPEERVRALGLSAREVEMAVMIGRGLTNKEIAAQLFISPATVRTHIYNLYQKVGAGSRVELINMLRS
ncbi:MAG: LuxR C-terminal-related transcriptional regulator [Spirochaeta sp.]|jgi:DNA-binding CsgD family transcriptional regulator|nr:LuxR C-terminal-related transcriptional regulator [Spirochaeta sp.]